MAGQLKGNSYLVRYKPRISRSRKNYRTTVLFRAVMNGKKRQVQRLLKEGAVHINALAFQHNTWKSCGEYDSLLMVNAIHSDCAVITRMLIRAGCRLNTTSVKGTTALQFAVWLRRNHVARELIRAGANIRASSDNGSLLLYAAFYKTQYDIIRKLISDKEAIASYPKGLSYAVNMVFEMVNLRRVCSGTRGSIELRSKNMKNIDLGLIKMLLNAGADVHQKDYNGCSAIHYAAFVRGNLALAKFLINAGADIDSLNNINATALHNAVMNNDEAMVLFLLKRGASVSIKTTEGNTALHWASRLNKGNSHVTIIRYLIDFGSNVNHRVDWNETILSLALETSVIIEYVTEIEERTHRSVFDERNLAVIEGNQEMKSTYENCQAELTFMRNVKIGNTLISYFSLLTEPLEVVARYARNEAFVGGFEASDYQTAYPTYASRLREKFDAAIARQKMIEKLCTILSKTTPWFANLNDLTFETIIKYLTEEDTNFLIKRALAEKIMH